MSILRALWADLPLALEHPTMQFVVFGLALLLIGIFLSRNEGRRFAWLAVQLMLALGQRSLEALDEAEVKRVVGALYSLLPGRLWVLPWKLLVSESMVSRMAWSYVQELQESQKKPPAAKAKPVVDKPPPAPPSKRRKVLPCLLPQPC